MSFFNGYIVAREQIPGASVASVPVPPAVVVSVGDKWATRGSLAKMGVPKRKWRLIKAFLEAELTE